MATVSELTDPHLGTYVPVPPVGTPGSCSVCHGSPNPGYPTCYSCADIMGQLSRPCPLVVPISLSEPFGQLHHVLKHYKNADVDAVVRNGFITQITAMLARFLHAHRSCIERRAGQTWNSIAIVPSTGGRVGEHPLETAIRRSPWLRRQFKPLLLPGPVPINHNSASDRGFIAQAGTADLRVLLVDDTYTSGSRSQSAASTLSLAGATVIAIVPVARIINPDWTAATAQLWDRCRSHHYDFSYCCVGSHPAPPRKRTSGGALQ